MSCGQIALNRCGIEYNNYYASEIDKHAIKVTQHNYPNTIQLGDVTKIDCSMLPEIDLLIGGSPCQGFSFAGKQLNFEDVRSKLFFEYVRILEECKPKYFLLENVKMKKEYQDIISDHLGVEPININSNLVSAQNRNRLYWTNIPNISMPEDKNILLKDILEDGIVDMDKSYCIDTNYSKGDNLHQYFEKSRCQLVFIKHVPHDYIKEKIVLSDKYPTLCAQDPSSKHKIYVVEEIKNGDRYYWKEESINKFANEEYIRKDYYKIESLEGKVQCLMAEFGLNHPKILVLLKENGMLERMTFRKLTPIECERLQTVPDNYTSIVSNNQRYKMIGNGWTVDVICHIFNHMKF